MKVRNLKKDEIEVRIGQIAKDGTWLTLLLYKNARVDMDVLDETFGALNWKREHVNNNANCIVSVYNKDLKEWISREDTGTESNTEKSKGLASDSFKRACVNFGIGRELYSSPQIFINPTNENGVKIEKVYNGKYKCDNKFYVKKILYEVDENGNETKKINALAIGNQKTGKMIFCWQKGK